MKTKNKQFEKEFDTVKSFRVIKDDISNDLIEKSTEEILEYLRFNSLKFQSDKKHFR